MFITKKYVITSITMLYRGFIMLLPPKKNQIFFALLTDFGFDFAVASIKGVLLSALPHSHIIDIDHTIEKFNVLSGAYVLEKMYRFLPKGTIIIGVVDPGVGSERSVLCVEVNGYTFVGPNNGLFHHAISAPNAHIYAVNTNGFEYTSNTFHGRDIFSPVAIALAQNHRSHLKSIEPSSVVLLPYFNENSVIFYIDSFGNIKTTYTVPSHFAQGDTICVTIQNNTYEVPFAKTFAHVASGVPLCYKGSNNTLEIAVNYGSAGDYFQATVGDVLSIHRKPDGRS
jgi:S-adenosylmethionine hydrolase